MAALIHLCGAEYEAGAPSCPGCGLPIEHGATMPLSAARPVGPAAPADARRDHAAETADDAPVAARAGVVCPGCGRRNDGGRATCYVCGTALDDTVELVLPSGARVPLVDGEALVVGRHSPNAVVHDALVDFDQVSREHVELVRRGDLVHVRDLHSTNGTFVDGRPVTGPVELPIGPGLRLRLGRELELGLARTRRDTGERPDPA